MPLLKFLTWPSNKVPKSFRLRLSVGLSAIIFLIMGIGAAVMVYERIHTIQRDTEERGLTLSRTLAMMGAEAVLDNLFLIQEALGQHNQPPDVMQIDVIDTDDMVMASQNPKRIGIVLKDPAWHAARDRQIESLTYSRDNRDEPILVIVEPLLDHGRVTAWIRVVFSLTQVQHEVWSSIIRLLVLTLALMTVGIIAVRLILRHMTGLLHRIGDQLQGAMAPLERLTIPYRVEASHAGLPPEDELEHLIEVVTQAINHLKTQSDALRTLTTSLEDKVKERTDELERQRMRAETAYQLKSTFLANMSHELRTPLNGIVGMLNLLANRTDLADDQREYVRIAGSSAVALTKLIDGVLDLSKMEAGKLETVCIPFELRNILESTLEALTLQAAEKGIELVCRVDNTLQQPLKGDPEKVREILLNLVGNALKFTEQGEVEVHTGLTEESPDSLLVKFTVRDTGIGIPMDKQALIFEPFTQIAAPAAAKTKGTGLGLSISKQLTELMGGRIGVISEPHAGSTFWFTVRFSRDDSVHAPPLIPAPDLRGVRMLLVDDNATNRKMLSETFAKEGALTDEASSGEACLLALKKAASTGRPFDLVVLDDEMPDLDGSRVAEAIHIDPGINFTPLILMTSIRKCREAPQLQTDGFAAALTKPILIGRLFEAVSIALRLPLPSTPEPHRDSSTHLELHEKGLRGRILLVEDNEVNQMVVKYFLRDTGYHLDIVSTEHDALAALEKSQYDVLLLDIRLPDTDGVELATRLHRMPRWETLPIIALTAHSLPEDRERCLTAGLTGYLVKPLDQHALIAAIENALASTTTDLH